MLCPYGGMDGEEMPTLPNLDVRRANDMSEVFAITGARIK